MNLRELPLVDITAHRGIGKIRFARVTEEPRPSFACHFIDLAVLPPGTSIGRHQHARDNEEFYLLLAGEGTMWQDGETFIVREGDLVRNGPGAAHGLENTGTTDLRLFVFEVGART